MLAAATGFCFGCLQLVVLYYLIKALLDGNAANVFALVMLKLVMWGGFAAATVLLFRDAIVLAGTGAAGTLVVGSFAGFWFMQRKQHANNEEKTVC